MTIPIALILVLTILIWLINKKLQFKICPICAGVFLTWTSLLVSMAVGFLSIDNYQLPTAILAGGTIIGIMSKSEKFIRDEVILIWKASFTVFGFLTIYNLIRNNWLISILGIVLLILLTFIFKKKDIKEKIKSEESKILEEKMKNCC